jgi:hypothetical protein
VGESTPPSRPPAGPSRRTGRSLARQVGRAPKNNAQPSGEDWAPENTAEGVAQPAGQNVTLSCVPFVQEKKPAWLAAMG